MNAYEVLTSELFWTLFFKSIFVSFVLIVFFKLIKAIYLKITFNFYSVPDKVESQHFWITEVKNKNKTYYLLNIRKTWGNKFINVIHRSLSEESHFQHTENTEFHSIEEAEKIAKEISEYYANDSTLGKVEIIYS